MWALTGEWRATKGGKTFDFLGRLLQIGHSTDEGVWGRRGSGRPSTKRRMKDSEAAACKAIAEQTSVRETRRAAKVGKGL